MSEFVDGFSKVWEVTFITAHGLGELVGLITVVGALIVAIAAPPCAVSALLKTYKRGRCRCGRG